MNTRRFWLTMRNISAFGALLMFALALVAAQTDLKMLPIGGSTSDEPVIGSIWACRLPEGGRGATGQGTWI